MPRCSSPRSGGAQLASTGAQFSVSFLVRRWSSTPHLPSPRPLSLQTSPSRYRSWAAPPVNLLLALLTTPATVLPSTAPTSSAAASVSSAHIVVVPRLRAGSQSGQDLRKCFHVLCPRAVRPYGRILSQQTHQARAQAPRHSLHTILESIARHCSSSHVLRSHLVVTAC